MGKARRQNSSPRRCRIPARIAEPVASRAKRPDATRREIHSMHAAGGKETHSLGGPGSTQTKPHGSVAAYVVALSQTDTADQAGWMQALGTRASLRGGASRRVPSRDAFQARAANQ